jgi:YD repeat-containing protein
MTERDRLALRGSVKSCLLHRTVYSVESGPGASQTEERHEFRPDGSLERHWYKNPPPNPSEWTSFYEYDDGNKLTRERAEQSGAITITKLYEYDSVGRISQIIVLDRDGRQRVAETYSYDADSRKKKVVHIDPELPSEGCGTMFGVDGTDVAYGSPGAASITSIYDEHGRPFEHLFHDSGGELITRIDFRHDELGNLVEEVCSPQRLPHGMLGQTSPELVEAARMLFTLQRHHRYDAQARRVETSLTAAAGGDSETFTYNDHGDVMTTISESSQTDLAVGEEGAVTPQPDTTRSHRSETQFRYQYDSQGNWIEKITETPGGPIWSLERRTLSYF